MIPKQSKRLGKRMGLGHGMATLWHSGSDNGWNQGWRVFSFHKKRERAKEPPKNPRKITGYIVGVGVRCRWTCLDLDCFGTFFWPFLECGKWMFLEWTFNPFFFWGLLETFIWCKLFGSHPRAPQTVWFRLECWGFFFLYVETMWLLSWTFFFWKRNHYTKNHH